MASKVNPPRGMRDFLPAEKAKRERALNVIREVYRAHGFDEIETPVMEDSATLHGGLGGDNEKLGFAVMRRGLVTDDLSAAAEHGSPLALADLGLRFDLTVPLARFYASHRTELPLVFRAIQLAPVWRAERPQQGRYRQFLQCDIDIIGEAGQLAEVELLTATSAALTALGLSGFEIRVNDRRLLFSILDSWRVPIADRERVLVILDKLDKVGVVGVVAELQSLGLAKTPSAQAVFTDDITQLSVANWDSLQSTAPGWLNPQVFQELLVLRELVPSLRIDPSLVRGMGYYTGTIFEISHPDFSYSLGGGGRYDQMIGRFLGENVPACGFSIGFERIIEQVVLNHEDDRAGVVLIYPAEFSLARLIAVKNVLIGEGRRVRLERTVKNLRPILDRAETDGFGAFVHLKSGADTITDLEFRELGRTAG